MKNLIQKLGLTVHSLYRFPLMYLALLAGNALASKWTQDPGFPALLAAYISLLFTVILFYSISRVAVIFEKKESLYEGSKPRKEKFLFLWERPKTKLALLLFLLLPLPFPAFGAIFGSLSPLLRYLCSRLFLPFLFVAFFLGGMRGLLYHEQNEKKKNKKKKRVNLFPIAFLFHTFKYVPIYAAGAYLLLELSTVIFSLPGVVQLFLTTGLGVAIAATFSLLWTVRIFRAVCIRRKFLISLAKACKAQGIPIPKIEAPIRSLFRKKERGTLFEITVKGKKYVCKLVSTLKPITTYRFYPDGYLGHVRTTYLHFRMNGAFGGMLSRQRIELFEKKYNVGFDAENATKVLIFNPCSKIVEGVFAESSFPLDNGMSVGKYKFFTASGFCNAITRDCLDRKANE